jgi:cytochrome P450
MKPPIFEIDPLEFSKDPYPFLKEMRAKAPICYVPQLDAVLLNKRDDIFICEKNIEVFSSSQPGGLMTVLMGENMMRKDGDAHMHERKAIFPTISPKTVANQWQQQFETLADEILDELSKQNEMDVVADYAMRLSSGALKIVTGLMQADWRDMDRWSQSMIDGIANYAGDKEIEKRCITATAEIDAAITERMEILKRAPDQSMLSVLLGSDLPEASIRANIKLAISGGQNEQRDAIAGCVWALLEHPDQLEIVRSKTVSWMQVFEEYSRWMAPIGMSPRRINKDFTYNNIDFMEGQRGFLMFGSANRDEDCFAKPDIFDVRQDTAKSIAFGAGPHFCAGAWISRALVADVGLPKLFEKFLDMKISGQNESRFSGWAFRGLNQLRVDLH